MDLISLMQISILIEIILIKALRKKRNLTALFIREIPITRRYLWMISNYNIK